jgi:Bax protein
MIVSKQRLLGFLFIVLLGIGLIAPFTFLPVQVKEQAPVVTVEEPKIIPKVVKVIEQPLHDVILPDFASISDVKEKKKQFFAFIKPAILAENESILTLRSEVERLIAQLTLEQPFTEQEHTFVADLSKQYRVSKKFSLLRQLYELQLKVDVIPPALILVQAANESAWGTSRFARIGLNFFGVWCYKKGCGMVPSGRNVGAKHEVAAYSSVKQGVSRYLKNINTNSAYMVFRTIRGQLREQDQPLSPEILATGLIPYSERGTDYVLELTEMIRHNRRYLALNAD